MQKILHLNKLQKEWLDASVPAPIYDEKTIPKNTYETLFAQDFSGTSGNYKLIIMQLLFYLLLHKKREQKKHLLKNKKKSDEDNLKT